MLYQNYAPHSEELEKTEDVYENLFKRDVELKEFVNGGHDVMYVVDFKL